MDNDLTKFYYEPVLKELERRVDVHGMIRRREEPEFIAGIVYAIDLLRVILDDPDSWGEDKDDGITFH